MCVCRLRYAARNAREPYRHLWPAPLYNISLTLSQNRHEFRGQKFIEYEMCASVFSINFARYISHSADIQGCASLLMSALFSLVGLPTHSQNPHSSKTSFSLSFWPLSYGLSGLGDPTRNRKFPPACYGIHRAG